VQQESKHILKGRTCNMHGDVCYSYYWRGIGRYRFESRSGYCVFWPSILVFTVSSPR